MSSSDHVLNNLSILKKDRNLRPEVKAWFMMFKLLITFDMVDRKVIRDPRDEKYEWEEFVGIFGGLQLANLRRRRDCTICKRYNLRGDVEKIRGICCDCNSTTYGTVQYGVKTQSWFREYDSLTEAPCYCCERTITFKKFSAAHVIAAKYMGAPMVENIRPTCDSCNKAMGSKTLYIFKDELVRIREMFTSNPSFKVAVEEKWDTLIVKSKRTLSG